MAMPLWRTLVALQRTTCSSLKGGPGGVDVRQPLPLVVPVRGKKRYYVPLHAPAGKEAHGGSRTPAASRQEYVGRSINISCTANVFDPYVPPEGDARLSTLSKEGLKQRTERLKQSAASQLAKRKIKEHDPLFVTKTFPELAQDVFIQAHTALTQFNREKLHSLVTELCYSEMTRGNRYKTIRWSFVESLEPPRVVHIRCPDMVSKDNLYGQVTVRLHSRQTLAVYDRFGRLMLGSEEEPKDMLEYVVMEKHVVNPYGLWRLHSKIVPAWAPPKQPVLKTIRIPGPTLRSGEEFDADNFKVPQPQSA